MTDVGNTKNRFGGEYMVQDQNHMGEISEPTDKAGSGRVRQAEQSQTEGRQQGSGDNSASGQQGAEKRRKSH